MKVEDIVCRTKTVEWEGVRGGLIVVSLCVTARGEGGRNGIKNAVVDNQNVTLSVTARVEEGYMLLS